MLLAIVKWRKCHSLLCECDECMKKFVTRRYALRHRELHFCSRTCSNASQASGKLFEQVKKTNLERYGVEFVQQNSVINEKRQATNICRYGSCDSRRASLKTYLNECGVENVSQLSDHNEKVRLTSLLKYGVEHPFQAKVVKDKIETTCVDRYGVHFYSQSEEFLKSIDWKQNAVKRHETMKRAGTYAATETAPENACYEALCELFGEDDVERHSLVNGWDIDLRVNSLNTCI